MKNRKFALFLVLCLLLTLCLCLPCVANEGAPAEGLGILPRILISMAFGFGAALAIVLVMRYRMNTVRAKPTAFDYEKQNSYQLDVCKDVYLYSRVTRVRVSSPNQNNRK